ncbi:hypothetical protein [Actinoplanes sp. NPDC051494]|uniref:hypothetical protein n=1 Tax=Actinoplanes sp. NPDC051494 TaxID=3363907 RepID=UPI0037AA0B55
MFIDEGVDGSDEVRVLQERRRLAEFAYFFLQLVLGNVGVGQDGDALPRLVSRAPGLGEVYAVAGQGCGFAGAGTRGQDAVPNDRMSVVIPERFALFAVERHQCAAGRVLGSGRSVT